jgi:ribonucleoside-diphosphate reductase alpha chain
MTETERPLSPETVPTDSLANLSVPAGAKRLRLPDTRSSITHKFNISGHEGYVIVGLFENNLPGEVFLKVAKEGSTVRGLMDTIGVLTSLALQYGIPVEALAEKFEFARFEPSGWSSNVEIGHANSITDYLFRWLGCQFSAEYRKSHPPLAANGVHSHLPGEIVNEPDAE